MAFLRFLAELRTPAGDAFFMAMTYLASEYLVVALICFFYWCRDKKIALTLGVSYFLSGLGISCLKISFRVPRPWVLDSTFQTVPAALPSATGPSFPSGHTQQATSMWGTLSLFTQKKWMRSAALCLIVLAGFSRMYLGVHTPQDVIVAFVITLFLNFLAYDIVIRKDLFSRKPFLVSLVLLLLTVGLGVYAFFLVSSGRISAELVNDSFKASGAGAGFAVGIYLENRFIRFVPWADGSKKEGGVAALLLRYVPGIVVLLAIMLGLKKVLPDGAFFSALRYCLVTLWVTVGYPLILIRAGRQGK